MFLPIYLQGAKKNYNCNSGEQESVNKIIFVMLYSKELWQRIISLIGKITLWLESHKIKTPMFMVGFKNWTWDLSNSWSIKFNLGLHFQTLDLIKTKVLLNLGSKKFCISSIYLSIYLPISISIFSGVEWRGWLSIEQCIQQPWNSWSSR